MPETLRETFRKVSRRGSDLSSSPSHFLRTQFRKSAAFSVERKKKEEKKNRFVHFHLDADKIFDEKLCICLCISREIISNRVNILVEIGGKGNLPWQRLSLWNGSRCLDALSRFICPRRCRRRRRRRDSSARSKGKLKFSPTTVHQNSISPFSTASTSVKGEGKFSNAASRWQATGFGMIDRNGQLWRALVSRYGGWKIWAGWNKNSPAIQMQMKEAELPPTFKHFLASDDALLEQPIPLRESMPDHFQFSN